MATTLQQVVKKLKNEKLVGKPPVKNIFRPREIERTSEFLRIASMDRRDWEEDASWIADKLTPLLKTPQGTQKLRPAQAVALHDLGVYGGAACIIRVGGGKTLISFLAPYIAQAFRPLLIIPANLREKTKRDIEFYRQHWEIPRFIRIVTYEWLSHENQEGWIDKYRPDLFILDEAHRCKNMSAIVTKTINDYRNDCFDNEDYPDPPPFLLLSGTLTKDSVRDYWHMLRWTLPAKNMPLPNDWTEMVQWSMALDARVGDLHRARPGALLDLCNKEEKKIAKRSPLKAARLAYKRRLQSTPGVICTTDSYEAASLLVKEVRVKPPKQILEYFDKLRAYLTPDGQEIQDGTVVAQRAQELALGFYLKWKYPPPKKWLQARSNWCSLCRHIIKHNRRRLYSEKRVKNAIDRGLYKQHRPTLELWRAIEPSFVPEVEAVWVSDFAVDFAAKWAKHNKGIVWAYHPEFGRRLAEKSGIPFYHEGGFDKKGNFIENHPAKKPLVVSMKANKDGKNLQRWNTALMTYAPASGEWWEQIIGREHREGQEADEVRYDFMVTCIEHLRAFWKAKDLDAQYVEDTALKHKLLFADVDVTTVDDVIANEGSLWEETLPASTYKEEEET